MNNQKLQALCDEAVHVQRQLAALQQRADELRETIIVEAKSRDEDKVATDGGGESWSTVATDGSLLRVTFPAPTLKSCINPETPSGAKVMQKIGRHKDELLVPVLKYELVSNFRDKARQVIGGQTAESLIRACETHSSPKLSYELRES